MNAMVATRVDVAVYGESRLGHKITCCWCSRHWSRAISASARPSSQQDAQSTRIAMILHPEHARHVDVLDPHDLNHMHNRRTIRRVCLNICQCMYSGQGDLDG